MFSSDPFRTLLLTLLVFETALVLVVLLIPRTRLWTGGRLPRAWRRAIDLAARPILGELIAASVALALVALVAAERPPIPRIHDEFSYLLAADTFAHGRLANPPHPLWEHFESEHVLQRPMYVSKYPPAQGLFLAVGQVTLGAPIVGVWLSTAMLAGAVCWMIRPWAPARWALAGGLVVAAHPGILAWWGNTYWGGSVAALGGAMLFGGLKRAIDRPRVAPSLAVGTGLVILAASRPYEGAIAGLIAGVWLVRSLVAGSPWACAWISATRIVGPIAVVLALGAGFLALYNARTTGDPTRFAYQEHAEQYSASPLFVWQKAPEPPEYRHRKMADFYAGWERGKALRHRSPREVVSRTLEKIGEFWGFYVGPMLSLPLLALFIRRRRRGPDAAHAPRAGPVWIMHAAVWGVLGGTLLVVWFNPHYVAPITGPIVLLVVLGLRRLATVSPDGRSLARSVLLARGLTLVAMFPALAWAYDGRAEVRWSLERERITEQLDAEPGRDLVLVRHGRRYSPHEEWVYNGADIDGSPIVWAWEMGLEGARQLLDYYPDRRAWLLIAHRDGEAYFGPYPRGPAWFGEPDVQITGPGSFVAGAVGDVDSDGDADLVLIRERAGSLVLIVNEGDGATRRREIATGVRARRVAIADVTGDGAPDLVLLSSESAQVLVLPGDGGGADGGGGGGFGAGIVSELPAMGSDLAASDLDGDGQVDIAVSLPGAQAVALLHNDAGRLAAASLLPIQGRATGLAAGDLDGDGRNELAVTIWTRYVDPPGKGNYWTGRLRVVDDAFSATPRTVLDSDVGKEPTDALAADLDGDGDVDLAIAESRSDQVSIFVNDGAGGFARRTAAVGMGPRGLSAGDFDGDGRLDLACVTEYPWSVGVVLQHEPGRFEASIDLPVPREGRFSLAADLDGDGIDDLVVGQAGPALARLSGKDPLPSK